MIWESYIHNIFSKYKNELVVFLMSIIYFAYLSIPQLISRFIFHSDACCDLAYLNISFKTEVHDWVVYRYFPPIYFLFVKFLSVLGNVIEIGKYLAILQFGFIGILVYRLGLSLGNSDMGKTAFLFFLLFDAISPFTFKDGWFGVSARALYFSGQVFAFRAGAFYLPLLLILIISLIKKRYDAAWYVLALAILLYPVPVVVGAILTVLMMGFNIDLKTVKACSVFALCCGLYLFYQKLIKPDFIEGFLPKSEIIANDDIRNGAVSSGNLQYIK